MLILKIARKIRTDESARNIYEEYSSAANIQEMKDLLTPRQFDQAAANHCFDDNPEPFGITEHEGHAIRAALQQAAGTATQSEMFDRLAKLFRLC